MTDAKKNANDAFAAAFPHGYDLVPTSGEGLLCGLRAIAGSIETQLGLAAPELDDLVKISKDPGLREFEKSLGIPARENDENFHVDQVGAILSKWGKEQKPPLDLRLGYVMNGGEKHLVSSPDANSEVLWVAYSGNKKGGHYMGMRAKPLSTPPPDWESKSESEKKRWRLAYNRDFPKRHVPRNTDSEYTDDDSVSSVEDEEIEAAVAARDEQTKRSEEEGEKLRAKRAQIDNDIEAAEKKSNSIAQEIKRITEAQETALAHSAKAEKEGASQKFLNGIKRTISEQHKKIEALEEQQKNQEEELARLQAKSISLAQEEQHNYSRRKAADSKVIKLEKQQRQFLRRQQMKGEEERPGTTKGSHGGKPKEAVSGKQNEDLQQLVRRIIKLREAESEEMEKNLAAKLLRPFSDDEYSPSELEAMQADSETDSDDDVITFSRVKIRVPKKNDPVPLDFDSNTATTNNVTLEQVQKGLETLADARKEHSEYMQALNKEGGEYRRLGNQLAGLRVTLRYQPDREDIKAKLSKVEEAFAPYDKIEKEWTRKSQVIAIKTRQLRRLHTKLGRVGKQIPRIRRDAFGLSRTRSSDQGDKQSKLNDIERKLKEQRAHSNKQIKLLEARLAEKEKLIAEAEAEKKRVEEEMGARRLKDQEKLAGLAEMEKSQGRRTAAADKRSDELRQREKRIQAEEDKAREAAKKAEDEAKMLLVRAQDELERQKQASAAEVARLEEAKRRVEEEIAALKAAQATKRLDQQEKEDQDRQAQAEAEEKERRNKEPKATGSGGDGPPPPLPPPPPPPVEDDLVSPLYVGAPALATALWTLFNGLYRNNHLSSWMGPYINGGYNGMGTTAIFNLSSLYFLLSSTAALGVTFGWRLSKANF
ncbi:hypothetical protein QBC42DRAFT_343014 [Cladorrhinum samala]|uniref:Uncharacterized protein n=1 Tax=Cladorrhinum samala TaxID=585594 RepID=A0AAV9I2F2_9PEZI|nr:hypothetical protein QBC42DRAFT_343014 [Cladorrhinum samala]